MKTTSLLASVLISIAVLGCDNDRTNSTTDDAGSPATRPDGGGAGATGTAGMRDSTRGPSGTATPGSQSTPAPGSANAASRGQGTATPSGASPNQPTDAGNSGGTNPNR